MTVERAPQEASPRKEMPPRSLPLGFGAPTVLPARGVVQLPPHIDWSDRRPYDLDDRWDRTRVYMQALREGTEDDIRHLVDPDLLVELWDELYLPPHVRAVWEEWVDRRRGSPATQTS